MSELDPPVRRTGLKRAMIHGPRGAFRWTAYALAVTAFAAAIPTPLYPLYEQRFRFSAGVLALAFGAYTPGVLLSLFVLAPTGERLGRRPLLAVGMASTAVAAVTFQWAPDVVWLGVGRFVAGFAVGATTSVATAAMSDLEPFRDEHHVARVAVAANFGGFALGVTLSGLLAQFAPDPERLVYVLPIAASALGLLAVAATPETGTALGTVARRAAVRIAIPPGVRRPFWVAVGGIVACYAIYGLFAALVPSYVRSDLGLQSPLAAATAVALMFGTAAAVQLATSQVRDRNALLLGFPVMVGALLALVLTLSLDAWALLALVSAGLGAAVGLTFMGSVTLIDRVAPESNRDRLLAEFYAAGYLALAVPTFGVAEASERIGLTDAGALFGAVLAAAVVGLFAVIFRTPTPAGGGGRPRPPG